MVKALTICNLSSFLYLCFCPLLTLSLVTAYKEISMNSIADGSVIIQTSVKSVPSTPSWFGEVALMAAHLRKQGVLTKISERVRFARRRFGRYEGAT